MAWLIALIPAPLRLALAIIVTAGATLYAAHLYDTWIDDPAVAAAARQDYVLRSEADAARARAEKFERQAALARQAADQYAAILQNVRRQQEQTDDALERAIAEREAAQRQEGGAPRRALDAGDIEWLRRH